MGTEEILHQLLPASLSAGSYLSRGPASSSAHRSPGHVSEVGWQGRMWQRAQNNLCQGGKARRYD